MMMRRPEFLMTRRPEFLTTRRPEFLMMRRPCAALRRPENPDRSVPILLLLTKQLKHPWSILLLFRQNYCSYNFLKQIYCYFSDK
jgi:hypothetical protein